jgi:hypothetical protein
MYSNMIRSSTALLLSLAVITFAVLIISTHQLLTARRIASTADTSISSLLLLQIAVLAVSRKQCDSSNQRTCCTHSRLSAHRATSLTPLLTMFTVAIVTPADWLMARHLVLAGVIPQN